MILLDSYSFGDFMTRTISEFWKFTGFYNCEWENLVMLAVGIFFVWLAIRAEYPL